LPHTRGGPNDGIRHAARHAKNYQDNEGSAGRQRTYAPIFVP
jgi:hypothetical protein